MDLTASTALGDATRADPPPLTGDLGRAAPIGAGVVLLGTVITTLGLSWDVQWHVDVGPDTFFTLSHLALYTGSALSGIGSLVMVLLVTSAQRAGRTVDRRVGGTPIRVFGGAFRAPLGYLISGIGAASFLLYGLLDLWWHTIYGFDATLSSPPHVALFLSISITMVGSVIVLAAARDQGWSQAGMLLAIPILITFTPVTTNAFAGLPLPFDAVTVATVFFSVMLLILGAVVLRRPGAAIAIAAVLGAMQAFLWWFSPWASHTYAASVGLPLRDGLTPHAPKLPGAMPMFLILGAIVVEAALWAARKDLIGPNTAVRAAGGVAGLVVAVTLPLQQVLTDPSTTIDPVTLVSTVVAGALLGVLGGFLAGRFAVTMQALAPAAATDADTDPRLLEETR